MKLTPLFVFTHHLYSALTLRACRKVKKRAYNRARFTMQVKTLYAPRFGFTATVPVDWEGMLPRESEVFLLTPTGSVFGEIYVYALESMDLDKIKSSLDKRYGP